MTENKPQPGDLISQVIFENAKAVESSFDLNDQITLRDKFAAAALTGLLNQGYDKFNPTEFSYQAYKIADAMLEARK